MGAKIFMPTSRAYNEGYVYIRYLRPEDAVEVYEETIEMINMLASAAGAVYRLPKTTLIHRKKLEEYMKHLCKVPGTEKYVKKEFVRIGEGSIMYSIGHHRFIEMARAAGAVYKLGEAGGSTILINLEIFDEYMENFHQEPIPMKHPLYKPSSRG